MHFPGPSTHFCDRRCDTRRRVRAVVDLGELVPVPSRGRVFEGRRRVRLGDVSPAGRLRLDALARYLQDVSNDDTRDAGMSDELTWVVRRVVLRGGALPGAGRGAGAADVLRRDRAALGRAARLGRRRPWRPGRGRHAVGARRRGRAAGAAARRASWSTSARPPVAGPCGRGFATAMLPRLRRPRRGRCASPTSTCWDTSTTPPTGRRWRSASRVRRHLRAPLRAELEFRTALEVGAAVALRTVDGEDGSLALWVTDGQLVSASAVVRPWP